MLIPAVIGQSSLELGHLCAATFGYFPSVRMQRTSRHEMINITGVDEMRAGFIK
jgi:hypothetical protein